MQSPLRPPETLTSFEERGGTERGTGQFIMRLLFDIKKTEREESFEKQTEVGTGLEYIANNNHTIFKDPNKLKAEMT